MANVDDTGYTPTGLVEFFADGVPLGPAGLNEDGRATFTTSVLSTGSHSFTATYEGDADFSGSSTATALTATVAKATPTVGLTVSPSPVDGQPVTLTATLPADASGSVTFQACGSGIGSAAAYPSDDTALQFDGGDDYVAIPNLDLSSFTFSAWVNLAAGGPQFLIASQNSGSGGLGLRH